MLFQKRLNDFALHADSSAVYDPNLLKAKPDSLIEVFLDGNRDLPRLKRVKVEGILYWDFMHETRI